MSGWTVAADMSASPDYVLLLSGVANRVVEAPRASNVVVSFSYAAAALPAPWCPCHGLASPRHNSSGLVVFEMHTDHRHIRLPSLFVSADA